MKKALLLINTHSRSGQEAEEEAIALLRNKGISCEQPDDPHADWCQLISDSHNKYDLVIVGGGDGTMNLVAPALSKYDITAGILPLGTANDLSRTLNIPDDLDAACEVISSGRSKTTNVGLANGKHFFNVANIGYGVEVNRQLSDALKKRFGTLSYLIAAIKAWLRHRPFRAEINTDNRIFRYRVMQLAIGNGCFYGGGMRVHDEADIEEDSLCVYLIRSTRLLGLLLKAGSFRSGKIESIQGAVKLKSRKLSVTTRKPRTVMADGEILTETPVTFEILSDAVTVMVPQSGEQQ